MARIIETGFVVCMVTPIIKAIKGNRIKSFYTLTDYNKWKETVNVSQWKIKYYKGLGTSTSKEAKEYFQDLKINEYEFDEQTDEAMTPLLKRQRLI